MKHIEKSIFEINIKNVQRTKIILFGYFVMFNYAIGAAHNYTSKSKSLPLDFSIIFYKLQLNSYFF